MLHSGFVILLFPVQLKIFSTVFHYFSLFHMSSMVGFLHQELESASAASESYPAFLVNTLLKKRKKKYNKTLKNQTSILLLVLFSAAGEMLSRTKEPPLGFPLLFLHTNSLAS